MTTATAVGASLERLRRVVRGLIWADLGVALIGLIAWGVILSTGSDAALVTILGGALLQSLVSLALLGVAIVGWVRARKAALKPEGFRAGVLWSVLLGTGSVLGALGAVLASIGSAVSPWGRPLRVRGQLVHPELTPGEGWARGARPQVDGLSEDTRRALATLWLHDAQKEHASVPAFSRVGWILAGLGAPADLLERTHLSALQEIKHARRCLALAAGYAGQERTVEPIPQLLKAELVVSGDALEAMALESLRDGCLVEDFNADVATRACEQVSDPAAREVVTLIARDERAHAQLAWDILAWCLERGGERLKRVVRQELERLPEQGPIPYGADDARVVGRADAQALQAHGRVPAEEWGPLYEKRLALTRERVERMTEAPLARAA